MRNHDTNDEGDLSAVLGRTIATVLRILDGMGASGPSKDSVIVAPSFYDGPVLLPAHRFGELAPQLAVKLRFVGYSFDDVALLSVKQLCEKYLRDSFPPLPAVPLADDAYDVGAARPRSSRSAGEKGFPICFVLGAPRSGTTLLRAMLDLHTDLWAPGELHLANFETMAERAEEILPVLRYMPIPEAASRCGVSSTQFARTFRRWELDAEPVANVYQHLHDVDPEAMIVDKSPPYCMRRETLEWISDCFPNARFVHIIRSPHDVIRSYVRMQFHRGDRHLFERDRNPYQVAEAVWYTCNANVERFIGSLPANRKCAIRYEDLTSTPANSLRAICDLLEKDFQSGMADPYAKPGGIAKGAGDLHINLMSGVERREPIEPFFELGAKCLELAHRYAY